MGAETVCQVEGRIRLALARAEGDPVAQPHSKLPRIDVALIGLAELGNPLEQSRIGAAITDATRLRRPKRPNRVVNFPGVGGLATDEAMAFILGPAEQVGGGEVRDAAGDAAAIFHVERAGRVARMGFGHRPALS